MGSNVRATSAPPPPSPSLRRQKIISNSSGSSLTTSSVSANGNPKTPSSGATAPSSTSHSAPGFVIVVSGSSQGKSANPPPGAIPPPPSPPPPPSADQNSTEKARIVDSKTPSSAARRNSVKIGLHDIPIVSSDAFMSGAPNQQPAPAAQRPPLQPQNRNYRRRNNGVYVRTNRNQVGNFTSVTLPSIGQNPLHSSSNAAGNPNFPSYLPSYPIPPSNSSLYTTAPHSLSSHQQYRPYQYGVNQPITLNPRPPYPVYNPTHHDVSGTISPFYPSPLGIAGSSYISSSPYGHPPLGATFFNSCLSNPQAGDNSQPGAVADHRSHPTEEQQQQANLATDTANHAKDGHEQNLISPPTTPNMSQFGGSYVAPRGPPRKPRQTGHAIWVGNLPPNTKISDLKDHFSRGATKDIESLFLITKSNCAFVNYRSHSVCNAAIIRFHDSRFQGARLVCRMRKNMPNSSERNSGSGEMNQNQNTNLTPVHERPAFLPVEGYVRPIADTTVEHAPFTDRYFIVKSLTRQDIELSIQSGVWATQQHNEALFNKAFETTENVYLIFSANKTGEYFGYARMASPISDEGCNSLKISTPDHTTATDTQFHSIGPRHIYTPPNEWAPPGVIVDDSSRGTIFWEAFHTPEPSQSPVESDAPAQHPLSSFESVASGPGKESPSSSKTAKKMPSGNERAKASPGISQVNFEEIKSAGRPFRIEWKSTLRVPFTLTRGLCNPWNSNKEVKIARDGTELETSLGRRLIAFFHSVPIFPGERVPTGPGGVGLGGLQSASGYPYLSSPFDPYSQDHPQGYHNHLQQPRFFIPYPY